MVLLLTTINVSAGALVLTARSAPAAAIVVMTARGARRSYGGADC